MASPFNLDQSVEYGLAVRLAPQVRRLTARNASPMTFTGTQTYLVGGGDVAVIDPGPVNAQHCADIQAALAPGERVAAILVTHTHVDHSPGVAALKAATGAPTYGFGPHGAGMSGMMKTLAASGADLGGGEGADRDFAPDHVLNDGDTAEIGDIRLTAIHTPGHLSNHLSFAMEDGAVFTGDLIMGWATTLVSPPDGDMAAFIASLQRMRTRAERIYYPGHGHPVEDPIGMIDHQIAHRRARVDQILDALANGPAAPDALTARIYTDVDPALHGAAARNVFAALLGLISENRVAVDGDLSPSSVFHLI
ncbi:MAG: MBL fold metallo-hydrolase [Pseudomonadota bacterium]